MSMKKNLALGGTGIAIGLLIGYFLFPINSTQSLQALPNEQTAQEWVTANTKAEKAVYLSDDVLKSLHELNWTTSYNGDGAFIYYARGDGQQKLILFRAKDGTATSKYYQIDRTDGDLKICPPICDLNSPMEVENQCVCKDGKN